MAEKAVPDELVDDVSAVRAWRAAARAIAQAFIVLLIMLVAIFLDKWYVGKIDEGDFEIITYLVLMCAFVVILYFVNERGFSAFQRLRDKASSIDLEKIRRAIHTNRR